MWSHTLYLEYLVLAATVAPAELIRVAASFGASGGGNTSRISRNASFGASCAYTIVLVLALVVAVLDHFTPGYLTSWRASLLWISAAVVIGCGVVGLEILVGIAQQAFKRNRTFRLAVNIGSANLGPGYLLAISVTAIAEEILYRGLWIGTLIERLGVSSVIAVCGAALAYAVGHLFFGAAIVVQKTMTGIVFGVLLVASGSVFVPLLAHLTQNMAVYRIAVAGSRQTSGGEPHRGDARVHD